MSIPSKRHFATRNWFMLPPLFCWLLALSSEKASVWVLLRKNTLCASRGICTCKNVFGCWCLHGNAHTRKRFCSWSLHLQLAWTEWRIERWPAHEINSSILCLSCVDWPSREGDTALYSCAARSSTGASPALLLPCRKATRPVHPWAGPRLRWPWALQQEAVRKDSPGAITNTGCTVSTSQSAERLSQWGVLPMGTLSPG